MRFGARTPAETGSAVEHAVLAMKLSLQVPKRKRILQDVRNTMTSAECRRSKEVCCPHPGLFYGHIYMKLSPLLANKYFLRSDVNEITSVARNVMYSIDVIDYIKSAAFHAMYSAKIR